MYSDNRQAGNTATSARYTALAGNWTGNAEMSQRGRELESQAGLYQQRADVHEQLARGGNSSAEQAQLQAQLGQLSGQINNNQAYFNATVAGFSERANAAAEAAQESMQQRAQREAEQRQRAAQEAYNLRVAAERAKNAALADGRSEAARAARAKAVAGAGGWEGYLQQKQAERKKQAATSYELKRQKAFGEAQKTRIREQQKARIQNGQGNANSSIPKITDSPLFQEFVDESANTTGVLAVETSEKGYFTLNELRKLAINQGKNGRYYYKGFKAIAPEVAEMVGATHGGFNAASIAGNNVSLIKNLIKPSVGGIATAGIISGLYNTWNYTMGFKKDEDDKVQKILVGTTVDTVVGVACGLAAGAVVAGGIALAGALGLAIVAPAAVVAGVVLLGAAALGIFIGVNGWDEQLKNGINGYIDQLQSQAQTSGGN